MPPHTAEPTTRECKAARRLLYFGTEEVVAAPRLLRAGALSAELVDGNLRAIRYAGREVLRAISYVVRDKDWGTYAPALHAVEASETAEGFSVAYTAGCIGRDGKRLDFRARIEGTPEGLSFAVEALPPDDFLTNRCGFTILHPIVGLAGTPVEVEHVDGSVEHAALPDLIAPWQPFKDMRAITHEVAPGVRATCRMEGDAFEMEDQRNWSDASYKTYVRPLALPWPYVLPANVPMRQSVTLAIHADQALQAPHPAIGAPVAHSPLRIETGGVIGRTPAFGLVITPEETAATLAAAPILAEIGPQTLLFHFDPTAGHGAEAMAGFAQLAALQPAETVLECVLPCQRPIEAELAEVARLVAQAGLRLDAVAVSPAVDRQSTPPGSAWPDCPPLEAVYAAARAAFPSCRIGGGMFSYFTELNRKRPPHAALDFVTHCTCPIVHDADDRSVMQSLEALPFILRSARAIIGAAKPYRIGPSTLGMRQNPYGARTLPNPERRRMTMTPDDPRQRGLFAAAFMIGYAARLVAAGVESFIGAALTGPFGLVEMSATDPRQRSPAFHAASLLAELAGAPTLGCVVEGEDRVLALAVERYESRTLLLANLTADDQRVALPWGERAALLDEDSAGDLAATGRRPAFRRVDSVLVLKPYAVARVEG
ncbi:hypothetical protein KHC23_05910 [Ancylobacter dichloromethanicus]|uniref:Uncharacterized protein n=1 Tax=Ancylobacter dichloromethanicus TaxID=518825 RepID=A0A9W6JBH0_9HYPH|nr:hypothetical protein [Ancylobacter dichloromethanicus]MBS7553182.1 hypothetical protein [Ancylobacter dichloromethanicus]GLK72959.1 hypothetical protein GCM10017643_30750 [Ancylobacter dichloromethanicus]